MSEIDPAKMTEAERTALFRSFAKDLQPNLKPRQTFASKVAPWIGGITAERERGLDWKQLATLCETNLKLKISPGALQRAVRDITKSQAKAAGKVKTARKPNAKPAGNSDGAAASAAG